MTARTSSSTPRSASCPIITGPMPRVLPGTTTTKLTLQCFYWVDRLGVRRPHMPCVLPGTTRTKGIINSSSSSLGKQTHRSKQRLVLHLDPSILISFRWLLLGLKHLDQYLQSSEKQETNRLILQSTYNHIHIVFLLVLLAESSRRGEKGGRRVFTIIPSTCDATSCTRAQPVLVKKSVACLDRLLIYSRTR
jgi:hypothetical protein